MKSRIVDVEARNLAQNSTSVASRLALDIIKSGYLVSANRKVFLRFAAQQPDDAYIFVMTAFELLGEVDKQNLTSAEYELKRFLFNQLRKFDRLVQREIQKLEDLKADAAFEVKHNGESKYVEFITRFERLYLGLECIEDEQRILLEMYFFQGLTMKEIAKKSAATPQAVHKRIQKALRDLRQFLNAAGMNNSRPLTESQLIESLFNTK